MATSSASHFVKWVIDRPALAWIRHILEMIEKCNHRAKGPRFAVHEDDFNTTPPI